MNWTGESKPEAGGAPNVDNVRLTFHETGFSEVIGDQKGE
jgi:hypothetical protein